MTDEELKELIMEHLKSDDFNVWLRGLKKKEEDKKLYNLIANNIDKPFFRDIRDKVFSELKRMYKNEIDLHRQKGDLIDWLFDEVVLNGKYVHGDYYLKEDKDNPIEAKIIIHSYPDDMLSYKEREEYFCFYKLMKEDHFKYKGLYEVEDNNYLCGYKYVRDEESEYLISLANSDKDSIQFKRYQRIRKAMSDRFNKLYLEEFDKDLKIYNEKAVKEEEERKERAAEKEKKRKIVKIANTILLIIIPVIVCAVSIFSAININRYNYSKQEKSIEKYELIKIK